MDDWENQDGSDINFRSTGNKWEGEDEEEDVKDSWEDEEEEKKDEEKKPEPVKEPIKTTKKPKKLLEKIEEKEQREREEAEKRALEKEANRQLTPEEIIDEKLRLEKLQRESDLNAALDTTFGGTIGEANGRLSGPDPETKEDFDELAQALSKKMQIYSKSTHFAAFAQELITDICVHLSSTELKKLKSSVDNFYTEKLKIEKGDKSKKTKGKGKAKLKMDNENSIVNEYSSFGYDDFDDFI